MADVNSKRISELIRIPGNSTCADCKSDVVEYASYNIGVFLCANCAGVHRSLGAHISKVKHLKLGSWEDSQVKRMEEVGNTVARRKFEERVPVCYRKPTQEAPHILKEQWIRAKYEREEFIHTSKQRYTRGTMEGYLYKRSKVDNTVKQRKFVLSEKDKILKYYVNDKKEPKAEIRILEINISFAPEKLTESLRKPAFQISFLNQGSTRHIFIYHNDPEVLVEWYMAIRSAKLNLLHVAHPTVADSELLQCLTQDFLKEGYLYKTGPKPNDGFKKRWCTLDGRKLMYHEQPMDPYPKGEIFLGSDCEGFSVGEGAEPTSCSKVREQGFSFHVKTPTRCFWFSTDRQDDRDEWISLLQTVIKRPMTPQDFYLNGILVKKRASSFFSIR